MITSHVRRNSWLSLLLAAVCIGGVAGCGDSARIAPTAALPGSPKLILLDTLILEESDSLYVARPELSVAIDNDGAIYIPDQFMNRVLRYTSTGRIGTNYGKAGDGPGEFRSTQPTTIVADTFVMQATAGRFIAYHRHTGAFLFQRTHNRAFTNGGGVVDSNVVLSLFDFVAKKGVLVVPVRDLFSGDQGQPEVLVPNRVDFPAEYLQHPALQAFSTVHLAAWSDSLLAGFAGVPYLVRYTLAGEPIDTVAVSWRSRRGFPDGWLDVFRGPKPPTLQQMVGAFSFLSGVWRLPNGQFALWYQENAVDESQRVSRFSGKAHISILSADLERACLDAPIPFPGTELPRLAVRGDTLYAIDQVSTGAAGENVATVIRRYRIADDDCEWVRTRHSGAPD